MPRRCRLRCYESPQLVTFWSQREACRRLRLRASGHWPGSRVHDQSYLDTGSTATPAPAANPPVPEGIASAGKAGAATRWPPMNGTSVRSRIGPEVGRTQPSAPIGADSRTDSEQGSVLKVAPRPRRLRSEPTDVRPQPPRLPILLGMRQPEGGAASAPSRDYGAPSPTKTLRSPIICRWWVVSPLLDPATKVATALVACRSSE